MLPTKGWISLPETSLPGLDPLGQRADRRQRVGRVLGVPAAAGEVVDDGDLVPARGEAHRGRPAEIPVTPEDQDPHDRARVDEPGRRTSHDRSARMRPGAIYSLPAVEPVILQADLFPPELTAIRIVGLGFAAAIAAFAIAPPLGAPQHRRAHPAADRARARGGLRHRAPGHDPRARSRSSAQRHPDRRRRGVRDPDPVPARGARSLAGLADHARALERARGARLGAVQVGRPSGAVP